MKRTISTLCFCLFFFALAKAQVGTKQTYSNAKYKFSFYAPSNLYISSEPGSSFIATCRPASQEDKAAYAECYEGIVFQITQYPMTLDMVMMKQGYKKVGNTYYTTDRVSDSLKTEPIKGYNWKGIYHKNVCGINCKENGFQAAAGECEFFYMANKKQTICISTNGKALDENTKKMILRSFQFL